VSGDIESEIEADLHRSVDFRLDNNGRHDAKFLSWPPGL
jgi:hypothetical protein